MFCLFLCHNLTRKKTKDNDKDNYKCKDNDKVKDNDHPMEGKKTCFVKGGKPANFLFLSFCLFLYVSGRQKGAEPTHHSSDLPIRFLEAAWTKQNTKKGGFVVN